MCIRDRPQCPPLQNTFSWLHTGPYLPFHPEGFGMHAYCQSGTLLCRSRPVPIVVSFCLLHDSQLTSEIEHRMCFFYFRRVCTLSDCPWSRVNEPLPDEHMYCCWSADGRSLEPWRCDRIRSMTRRPVAAWACNNCLSWYGLLLQSQHTVDANAVPGGGWWTCLRASQRSSRLKAAP